MTESTFSLELQQSLNYLPEEIQLQGHRKIVASRYRIHVEFKQGTTLSEREDNVTIYNEHLSVQQDRNSLLVTFYLGGCDYMTKASCT